MSSLELREIAEYSALSVIADFATLLGTYSKGFKVLIEPYDERTPNIPDPLLQFACLGLAVELTYC